MASSSSGAVQGSRVVVLDNGGDTCKVGLATDRIPRYIPNYAIKPKKESRVFVATDIEEVFEFSNIYYRRPIEKGYVVNWDLESQVWSRLLGKKGIDIKPKEHTLLVTEPVFNPRALRKASDEIAFEKYQFEALYRTPAAGLAARGAFPDGKEGYSPSCCLVVDSGYSFTHIVPTIDYLPMPHAVKRVNVGGKLLTNALKETVSFRAWNMMDETHTITDIKHKLCYVALDFLSELEATRKSTATRREFVMPNWTTRLEGYVKPVVGDDGEGKGEEKGEGKGRDDGKTKDAAAAAGSDETETKSERKESKTGGKGAGGESDEQVLTLNNERIAIPEILFSPSDIGIDQAGIAESVQHSIGLLPEAVRAAMLSNVVLVGGNTMFPNYAARFERELRTWVPTESTVRVYVPDDPIGCTWRGGAALARAHEFPRLCVTRAEWAEHGESICARKFPHA